MPAMRVQTMITGIRIIIMTNSIAVDAVVKVRSVSMAD
jgi:hypothetical protein